MSIRNRPVGRSNRPASPIQDSCPARRAGFLFAPNNGAGRLASSDPASRETATHRRRVPTPREAGLPSRIFEWLQPIARLQFNHHTFCAERYAPDASNACIYDDRPWDVERSRESGVIDGDRAVTVAHEYCGPTWTRRGGECFAGDRGEEDGLAARCRPRPPGGVRSAGGSVFAQRTPVWPSTPESSRRWPWRDQLARHLMEQPSAADGEAIQAIGDVVRAPHYAPVTPADRSAWWSGIGSSATPQTCGQLILDFASLGTRHRVVDRPWRGVDAPATSAG